MATVEIEYGVPAMARMVGAILTETSVPWGPCVKSETVVPLVGNTVGSVTATSSTPRVRISARGADVWIATGPTPDAATLAANTGSSARRFIAAGGAFEQALEPGDKVATMLA